MSKLDKLPCGSEVICSGVKTLDDLTNEEPIGDDDYGNKQYPISESIVDIELEGNHVYLQF